MAASTGAFAPASRARLVSTYYDTPDHALGRRGSSLRVRRHGRKFVQTVKAAGSFSESGLSRGEWEDRVADDHPDPEAAQTGPFLSPAIAARLRPLFRTEVSRLTIPLAPEPETRIEAAIDRGRICDGADTPAEPISEIELELKSGAPSALYDIALKLLHIAPLRLERRSKAERGYRLVSREDGAAKAVRAAAVEVHPGLTAEAVLRRVGRACLDHLLRNEAAVLAGDVEGIHQMRVAVRRLRGVLSAFAAMLPEGQRRWASAELRWFGDVLGEARNLDVFSSGLLQPARAALPIASEFDRLALATQQRRRTAQAAVVEAISSAHYTEALLVLLRWLDGDDWYRGGDALQQPIEMAAPALLERCRAKAEKRARNFSGQSAKKRHRLRIALKQLRYAAELLAPLFDAEEARQFIRRLKRLQDDLGDANDLRVAHDIVKSLALPRRRATGVAHAGQRVVAWHKRSIEKNEPKVRRHLNELLTGAPFWRAEGLGQTAA